MTSQKTSADPYTFEGTGFGKNHDYVAQIVVKFPDNFPVELQGPALLAFEKILRQQTRLDCRVFKDRMKDDSKLRVMMTPAQRNNL